MFEFVNKSNAHFYSIQKWRRTRQTIRSQLTSTCPITSEIKIINYLINELIIRTRQSEIGIIDGKNQRRRSQ